MVAGNATWEAARIATCMAWSADERTCTIYRSNVAARWERCRQSPESHRAVGALGCCRPVTAGGKAARAGRPTSEPCRAQCRHEGQSCRPPRAGPWRKHATVSCFGGNCGSPGPRFSGPIKREHQDGATEAAAGDRQPQQRCEAGGGERPAPPRPERRRPLRPCSLFACVCPLGIQVVQVLCRSTADL